MTKILNSIGRTDNGDKLIVPVVPTNVWNKFVDDIEWNNTYCPEPKRIIYNIGKKAYPVMVFDEKKNKMVRVKDENGKVKYGEPVKVLTTVVFFDDNTKVSVTNSERDGVKFEQVKAVPDADDSATVEVATKDSKEIGLVYAVLKRLMGYADKNGTIQGDGFGRRLRGLVNGAYDTVIEEAANKHKNKLAKAKYEATKGTAKPKRPSFADTVIDLRAAVDGMNEMINVLKADLEAAKAK